MIIPQIYENTSFIFRMWSFVKIPQKTNINTLYDKLKITKSWYISNYFLSWRFNSKHVFVVCIWIIIWEKYFSSSLVIFAILLLARPSDQKIQRIRELIWSYLSRVETRDQIISFISEWHITHWTRECLRYCN